MALGECHRVARRRQLSSSVATASGAGITPRRCAGRRASRATRPHVVAGRAPRRAGRTLEDVASGAGIARARPGSTPGRAPVAAPCAGSSRRRSRRCARTRARRGPVQRDLPDEPSAIVLGGNLALASERTFSPRGRYSCRCRSAARLHRAVRHGRGRRALWRGSHRVGPRVGRPGGRPRPDTTDQRPRPYRDRPPIPGAGRRRFARRGEEREAPRLSGNARY